MRRLILLATVFFAGCTVPAEVYFRNYSNKAVRLQATLTDRRRFEKLPNKVTFYDTATKKQWYGNWRSTAMVTWTDTATFYIDVPAFTVVNVADISRGLILGSREPDVMLLMMADNKTDTLTTGDYLSVTKKFKYEGYTMFKPAIYYYDVR